MKTDLESAHQVLSTDLFPKRVICLVPSLSKMKNNFKLALPLAPQSNYFMVPVNKSIIVPSIVVFLAQQPSRIKYS